MNNKIVTVTLLGLMLIAAVFMPLQQVFGQSSLGVSIILVDPSTLTGAVGSKVNLQGTIYTSNSSYQIIFSKTVVASGISDGYYVNANFTVPELPAGSYTLTLRDVKININATDSFTVETGYLLTATPQTAQEGNGISINVKVAAAQVGTSYSALVNVVSPASTQFTKTVQLGTPDSKGTASATITFPDSSFSPNGSRTDYAGTYNVNLNGTLAQTSFTIGFMSTTTVHRGDTINIHAVGYQAGETVTISATNTKGGGTFPSQTVTASSDGVISTNIVVPNTAAIGSYTMTISGHSTAKTVGDSQAFTVEGYTVKVLTVNLAGEVVPQINVQSLDPESGQQTNSTSGNDGIATFKLEKGNHVFTPFWNGVNVGASNITISGDSTITLRCQLTNLKITVRSSNGVAMPFVNINVYYQYTPSSGGTRSGSSSGQTGPSGSFTFSSTLAGARYTINASIYGQVFNPYNNSVSNLPMQATSEFVITCPSENMSLSVVGYNMEPIPNARIELIELTNGLFNSATTDSSGAVNTQVTFGTYHAKVYKDNILINETNIQAFGSSQKQIRCTLYGIQVSVSVVDFFGSPISNANVTLNGPATEKLTATTQGDGTATFTNVIGGNMQIIASAPGVDNGYQALALTVNQPTSVQVKMEKYVSVGGLLVQASTLLTLALIIVAVILVVVVELFIRRRGKHAPKS
jgi:hypothetical protein